MDSDVFAALADPTRLRIIELLASRPYAVGEIASVLGIRQPQATKHLQFLSRTGLVTIHPLAQRRIYALSTKPLLEARRWLDELAEVDAGPLNVLEVYQQAIELETTAAAVDPRWAQGRTITLERAVAADPELLWEFWTSPDRLRTWWGPDYFTVSDCELDLRPGGAIAIQIQEGDGSRYRSAGAFETITRPHRLSFTLGSLDANGGVLLNARLTVRFGKTPAGTDLLLRVEIIHAPPEAAAQVAGMRLGLEQSLGKLARAIEGAR